MVKDPFGTDLIPSRRVDLYLNYRVNARATRFSCIGKKKVTWTIIVTISDNNMLELLSIVLFYGKGTLNIFVESCVS